MDVPVPSPDYSGAYDVIFDGSFPADECQSRFAGERYSLLIGPFPESGAPPTATFFIDYRSHSADTYFEDERLVVEVPFSGFPHIRLTLGPEGLDSTAGWVVGCQKGEDALPVPNVHYEFESTATIRRDETPPTIRTLFVPQMALFSFGTVVLQFSEPLYLPELQEFRTKPSTLEEVLSAVSFVDAEGDPIFGTWGMNSGGWDGLDFARDSIGQEALFLDVRQGVVDRAGHPAQLAEKELLVVDAGPVVSELDLDAGPPTGLAGSAVYVESGPPCEVGGCVVIEGAPPPCFNTGPGPGALGWRMDVSAFDSPRVEVRFRTWSTSAYGTGFHSQDDAGFGFVADDGLQLEELAAPDGKFTHASEWLTRVDPVASSGHEDKGYVLGIGCDYLREGGEQRLVIDSITFTD